MGLSYKKKDWIFQDAINDEISLIAGLLKSRKKKDGEEINSFLHPKLTNLHAPTDLFGIEKAVYFLKEMILKKKRIIIFGDFDADGITSTVLLVSALQKLEGQISYRIPDREKDSHGLKKYHVDEMKSVGADLILTCDCGVNDREVVAYAASQGMAVIITDHHEPKEGCFPDQAIAVINPKLSQCHYPFSSLAGVGVAFKLISALASEMVAPDEIAEFLAPYFELVALGTVADCVPLVDENRILVRFGLECMRESSWDGIRMLFERSNIDVSTLTEDTIRFAIAPRLNAASRLGNVMNAVQLFIGNSAGHFERLTYLDQLNKKRQELTHQALKKAEDQDQKGAVVFVYNAAWRPGILGLVAGKLVEKTSCPVIALGDYDGLIHASCRSCPGISIIKGLETCSDLLLYFGGHDGAAGFRIEKEKLPELKERLQTYFETQEKISLPLELEGILDPSLVTLETAQILHRFRPFGEGNPMPRFCLSNVLIHDWKLMGAEQNHIRLFGIYGEKPIQIVGFFIGEVEKFLQEGKKYDLAVELDESVWQGERRVDIRLVDVRESGNEA